MRKETKVLYIVPPQKIVFMIYLPAQHCHLIEHSPGAQMGCHKTAMESLTHAHLIGPWLA